MQILVDNRPPELDPGDVGKSFREITRYLTSTMEAIDFNLAKNRRSIISSDGSASGMQKQIDQLGAAIVVLTNGVNSISNQMGTMQAGMVETRNDISSMQTGMTELSSSLTKLDEALTALDGRVTALEQQDAEQTE